VTVSRALRRLLRIRELEEEQSRLALESSLGDLHRLQTALAATVERNHRGRRLVEASARSGEIRDRMAGIEESRSAGRFAVALAPRIAGAEQDVDGLREDFLERRVERRQAETLIEEALARDVLDADRRSQQGLDDWVGNRRHGADVEAKAAKPADVRYAFRDAALDAAKTGGKKT
jgi:flagellar biosynthesis chaperone FliJ